jgi:SAM-dependent methyltransferase
MWTKDRIETQQRYRDRWQKYGYDSRSLGWSKDCQWVRFEAAFQGLREEDCASVIDFGCGFGDLLGYLRAKGWQGYYQGVDIVEALITEATRQYVSDERASFVCRDFDGFLPSAKATMAVGLGIFNHRLNQDNLEFIRETISCMWEATTNVVVCDFLSTSSEPNQRRDDLFYADPRQLFELATAYTRRTFLYHAYMPFEFQITMWHDDSFSISAPVFGPYVHLAQAQTDWRKRTTAS